MLVAFFRFLLMHMKIIPPQVLLEGYARGIFPMADSRHAEDVEWYSARKRGIIPINDFHVSSNVERIIRNKKYSVKVNSSFRQVITACANRETTWINDLIIDSYSILHDQGYAHSVEIFQDEHLVGGLYGVHLKAAFFGESMFRKVKEMDKVALYYCHKILKQNNFALWDTQFYTGHLARFGCIEIEAGDYEQRLRKALHKEAVFNLKR